MKQQQVLNTAAQAVVYRSWGVREAALRYGTDTGTLCIAVNRLRRMEREAAQQREEKTA